jgi:hypothetical protein
MARRIYWILFFVSIITGVIFYFLREDFPANKLLIILFIISMLWITSVHGIIAHSLNPQLKGGLIGYPILMGILFAVLFFICVFLIMPLFCPDFLNGF